MCVRRVWAFRRLRLDDERCAVAGIPVILGAVGLTGSFIGSAVVNVDYCAADVPNLPGLVLA